MSHRSGRVRAASWGPAIAGLLLLLLLPAPAAAAWTLPVEFRGATWFLDGSGARQGLYRTDGTPAGTKLVVALDGAGYEYSGLKVFGDELLFSYEGGYETDEPGTLWRSDGTSRGTRQILRARQPRGVRVDVAGPIIAGGRVFVTTQSVSDDIPVKLHSFDLQTRRLSPVVLEGADDSVEVAGVQEAPDGALYVTGQEGDRRSFWRVPAGSNRGVRFTADVVADGSSVWAGGTLFFQGREAATGTELWQTDGTREGTRIVADLTPGEGSTELIGLVAAGGAAYAVTRQQDTPDGVWRRLYRFGADGTATRVTGGEGAPPLFYGPQLAATRDGVFTTGAAMDETGGLVLVRPGAAVSETLPGVTGLGYGSGPLSTPDAVFYADSNRLLRVAGNPPMGSALVTTGLTNVAKDGSRDSIYLLGSVGGVAYFRAPTVTEGPFELWRSDGTPAGTGPITTPGVVNPAIARVSTRVDGLRDRRAPFRWTVTGTVDAPGADPTTREALCRGRVTIVARPPGSSSRTVTARARVRVRWTGEACAFRATLTAPRAALPARRGRLGIRARFEGSSRVLPSKLPKRGVTVRFG